MWPTGAECRAFTRHVTSQLPSPAFGGREKLPRRALPVTPDTLLNPLEPGFADLYTWESRRG